MLNAVLRRTAVFLTALIVSVGCSGEPQPLPTAPSPSALPPSPPPGPIVSAADFKPTFPSASQTARIYVGVNEPPSSYHGSPLASRYVIEPHGTFALQYSSVNYPFFEYRGTYTEAQDRISFVFEGSGSATAIRTGNSIDVTYDDLMQHSDFTNGVYTLVQR